MPAFDVRLEPIESAELPIEMADNLSYRDLVKLPLRRAAVIALLTNDGPDAELILTVRSDSLRHHAGQIAFPGGRVDRGESVLAAALRECHEEIGVSGSRIELRGCLSPIITITGFAVIPVVGIAAATDMVPEPGEVAEIFTVPLAWLRSPGSHRTESQHYAGKTRSYDVFEYHGKRIWGATATMIKDLLGRID